MSYPNWFDPAPWDETKPDEFVLRVLEDIDEQTPETQAAWENMANKMVEAISLFKEMVDGHVGIVQVTMQANNELDEHEMALNFRIFQRTYGVSGPSTGPDNWAAIDTKLNEIVTIFGSLVSSDIGFSETQRVSNTTPGSMMIKLGIFQTHGEL